jgi:hypothetical protein
MLAEAINRIFRSVGGVLAAEDHEELFLGAGAHGLQGPECG